MYNNQNELSTNLSHWDYINRYSLWMYHSYMNYIGSHVFEVGAGMGRNVEFYIDRCEEVIASDIFPSQILYMKEKFQKYQQFDAVLLNIMEDDLSEYREKFDTILCINVLEHLSDDYLAAENMKSLLKVGGILVFFVPALQRLYCQLDRNVNHYRRYDPGRLEEIAKKAGLEILKHRYFNMAGIFPYWLKGKRKIQKGESFSTSLNASNSQIYNWASRILEPIERCFPPKIGISELLIVRK